MELREYTTAEGRSPFAEWFAALDPRAAAKITTALHRLALGNVSSVESVSSGVLEYKINFGPGYRIYFGMDGTSLVILLGGGTKKRQQNDIRAAISRWQDFKSRKKGLN